MKEKKFSKRNILLLIIFLMIVALVWLGGTYAFFRVSTGYDDTLSNVNIEFQDCLDVTYSESNVINLSNQYPISDSYALANLTPATVSITNNCEVSLNYTLVLTSLSNDPVAQNDPEYIPDDAMKISLKYSDDGETYETLKSPRYLYDVSTVGSSTALYTYLMNYYDDDETAQDYANRTLYKLDSFYVEAGETNTYQTYLWIDYYEGDRTHQGLNDNDTMDMNFNAMFSIVVNAEAEDYPLYSTSNGTLKANDLSTSTFGDSTVNKNRVESIILLDYVETPGNAIKWWDVSSEENKSIIAWIYDKDNDNQYELYIGQEGGVVAPSNSAQLFYDFVNVTYMDLHYLDTSNSTTMNNWFHGCTSLQSLDLSSFDTSSVTNMISMFSSMTSVQTIYVSNLWDTSLVTGNNSNYMFGSSNVPSSYCSSLVGGSGTPFDSSYTDVTYARVDNPPGSPGYFTLKTN
jgi:surface protein